MKQPISILLAGILAMSLSACGPKADTTAGSTATDTSATATTGQPAVVNPDSNTAGTNLTNATTPGGPGMGSSADPTSTASGANMGTDTSAMGSTAAAGTTASGSGDMSATSSTSSTGATGTSSHAKAPGTNEAHPRAEAVNRANGVK